MHMVNYQAAIKRCELGRHVSDCEMIHTVAKTYVSSKGTQRNIDSKNMRNGLERYTQIHHGNYPGEGVRIIA